MASESNPPSGFRDFLPLASVLRGKALETISSVYRSYGFSPIETPCVEALDILTGKAGGENEKLIFKILKRGEKLDLAMGTRELADLGLRFDLTLPLARYYADNRGRLPTPFKAYHIGPVWRAERAQKGRYREFLQCDADILGSDGLQAEIEVISAVLSAFDALGVKETSVVLNDRAVLFSLFEAASVPPEKRGEASILLDKIDKVGAQAVGDELEALLGRAPAGFLKTYALAEPPNLNKLAELAPEALKRLNEILLQLGAAFHRDRLRLHPSLVRGLDYYTGTVFEFRHPQLSGSLGGGGRYDRLTEQFGISDVPACGASIGFERLMLILEESGRGGTRSAPHACVCVFSDELRGAALKVAAALRGRGLDIDVYPGSGKLKAQFKYADSRGAAYALVIGPDEDAASKIKAKDLKTGNESLESLESLAVKLQTAAA